MNSFACPSTMKVSLKCAYQKCCIMLIFIIAISVSFYFSRYLSIFICSQWLSHLWIKIWFFWFNKIVPSWICINIKFILCNFVLLISCDKIKFWWFDFLLDFYFICMLTFVFVTLNYLLYKCSIMKMYIMTMP